MYPLAFQSVYCAQLFNIQAKPQWKLSKSDNHNCACNNNLIVNVCKINLSYIVIAANMLYYKRL